MVAQPKYVGLAQKIEVAKVGVSNLDKVLAGVVVPKVSKGVVGYGDYIGYGDYGYADFSGYTDWGYWDYGDNLSSKLLGKYSGVNLVAGYNIVFKK